jgi:hypothetical protein
VIRGVYYREAEDLLNQVTGANRVFIFDHTLRRRIPSQVFGTSFLVLLTASYCPWPAVDRQEVAGQDPAALGLVGRHSAGRLHIISIL